jgi:hypothetical protein
MSIEQDHNIKNIDVIIVMDSTASMQSWINSAKNTLLESFNDIRNKYTESIIRLGLVCYRDIGDDEQYVVAPLTENIESIQGILKDIRAEGGNDTTEDVAGALEKVLELFRENQRVTDVVRTVLFVTDAPAHGLRYHTITVGDRFPNGDPSGKDPYNQVRELGNMNVDLTIFRVNSLVDKMIEEFEKAFKGTGGALTILDIENQTRSSTDEYNTSLSLTSSSLTSSSLTSSSLTSGFIDLSTYDDYDKFSYDKEKDEKDDKKYHFSTSESIFRNATCETVTNSIQRRRKTIDSNNSNNEE